MTQRKPYRPSNATEFDGFYARNCEHCVHDDPENEVGCNIIVQAMVGKDAPQQWVRDPKRGPICTAYTEDQADPSPCPDTRDMFG
jgi:hypothetical protein